MPPDNKLGELSGKLAKLMPVGQGAANCPIFSILAVVSADTTFHGVCFGCSARRPAHCDCESLTRGASMSLRNCYLLLIGVWCWQARSAAAAGTGARAARPATAPGAALNAARVFWHEWFSCPPLCRDFCNCCGDFTASDNPYVLSGPTEGRFGPLYDDGSRRNRPSGSQLISTNTIPSLLPTTAAADAGRRAAAGGTDDVGADERIRPDGLVRHEPRHDRRRRVRVPSEDQARLRRPIDSPRHLP